MEDYIMNGTNISVYLKPETISKIQEIRYSMEDSLNIPVSRSSIVQKLLDVSLQLDDEGKGLFKNAVNYVNH